MGQERKLTPLPTEGPLARPRGPWTDRIAFSENGSSAFRPNQLICPDGESASIAADVLQQFGDFDTEELLGRAVLFTATKPFDVEEALARITEQGGRCEPNHVLFTHAGHATAPTSPLDCWCGCCPGASGVAGNPFFANGADGVTGNPFFANSVQANPFFANPFFANPFFANPFFANPFFANPFFANTNASGVKPSSALPVPKAPPLPQVKPLDQVAKVIILDTGIAAPNELPALLPASSHSASDPSDIDPSDHNGDGFLDSASGHGTFIAGLVEQLAPNQDVYVFGVLSSYGDGDVAVIAKRLELLITDGLIDDKTIVNLSFGSYADDDMELLANAVAAVQKEGAVVVASAGNDGTCRPSFPACLPDVVSVGSIDPSGRAYYSNHGPWVRCCAPGTGLISAFYDSFTGSLPAGPGGIDPDDFDDWAQWTGTSFSAPVVTAAIARHMAFTGSTAAISATALVDSAGLFRYPGLGTVINLATGM